MANKHLRAKQQILALRRGNSDAASGGNSPNFWRQAASNLQNFSN